MKVELKKNYKDGNLILLKGTKTEVTPWLFNKLSKGGYLDDKKRTKTNAETAALDINSETLNK